MPKHIQVFNVINTNFFGIINVCDAFFPLLTAHSRVVNLSSDWGLISYISNEKYRKRFLEKDLTIECLIDTLNDYLE